jgi:hypothetical protein
MLLVLFCLIYRTDCLFVALEKILASNTESTCSIHFFNAFQRILFRLIWHSLSLFSRSVSLFFVILWYAHESWVFLRKSNYLFWNCGMIIIGIYWVIVGLMNLHWVLLSINDSYFHYLPLFNLFLLSLSLKSFSLLVSKVVWPNRKAKDKMTKTWTERWFLWQHVFNKYFLTFSILRCLSVWCSYLSISCNINSLVRKEVNNSKLFWIGINWRPYKQ